MYTWAKKTVKLYYADVYLSGMIIPPLDQLFFPGQLSYWRSQLFLAAFAGYIHEDSGCVATADYAITGGF